MSQLIWKISQSLNGNGYFLDRIPLKYVRHTGSLKYNDTWTRSYSKVNLKSPYFYIGPRQRYLDCYSDARIYFLTDVLTIEEWKLNPYPFIKRYQGADLNALHAFALTCDPLVVTRTDNPNITSPNNSVVIYIGPSEFKLPTGCTYVIAILPHEHNGEFFGINYTSPPLITNLTFTSNELKELWKFKNPHIPAFSQSTGYGHIDSASLDKTGLLSKGIAIEKCTFCNKKFSMCAEYCSETGEQFRKNGNLIVHHSQHCPKGPWCPFCNTSYANPTALRKHVNDIHHYVYQYGFIQTKDTDPLLISFLKKKQLFILSTSANKLIGVFTINITREELYADFPREFAIEVAHLAAMQVSSPHKWAFDKTTITCAHTPTPVAVEACQQLNKWKRRFYNTFINMFYLTCFT